MKKNILVKLAGIAAAVSLLVGGAYAAFTSNSVTISNVNLTSATPALQVWNGSSYQTTANGATLGIVEANMYPGLYGAIHPFYLRNSSDASVPFGQIIGTISWGNAPQWDAYKDNVQMRFGEVTADTWTGWNSLNWWNTTGANFLASQLAGGNTKRRFRVQFYMNSGAPNTLRGSTLQLTLSFVGQTP